jgi:hypothetical protein
VKTSRLSDGHAGAFGSGARLIAAAIDYIAIIRFWCVALLSACRIGQLGTVHILRFLPRKGRSGV